MSYAHSLAPPITQKIILTRRLQKKLAIGKYSFRVIYIVEATTIKAASTSPREKCFSFLIALSKKKKKNSGKQEWFRTICQIFCPTLGRLKRPTFVLQWRSSHIKCIRENRSLDKTQSLGHIVSDRRDRF